MTQALLREAIEARPAVRRQIGDAAYAQLLDIVTHLDDCGRVNGIWAYTMFPIVLNAIERECRDLRPAINLVRKALRAVEYHGHRMVPDRVADRGYDTREEKWLERRIDGGGYGEGVE